MKTKTLFLALSVAIIAFASCTKDEPTEQPPTEANEAYIDATSKTTWHYFSLSDNKVVGTGEENDVDNKKWAARADWDVAVNRYTIRTNSGAATTTQANGGVYTFATTITFDSIIEVPINATFIADKAITSEGMGGVTTKVQSAASVIVFKTNEDGSMAMPPVYLQAPVYVFRTANGSNFFKVQFTQYQDENKASGHVKFYSTQIK